MASFRSAIVFVIAVACAGCGSDGRDVEVYPVRGKVLVNGQPAEGARVVLYPQSSDLASSLPTPEGTAEASGEFQLRSYEPNDGAPAGEYKVTVVWPAPPPPDVTDVYELNDRLRWRYSDPERSGLTASVEEGGGELPPFDLQ